MNVKSILTASLVYLITTTAIAAPINPDDLFSAPEQDFLSCTGVFGETDDFRIAWAPILEVKKNGAVKKYASEINCDVIQVNPENEESPAIYGSIEVSPEALPASECPLEGDLCSTSVPMADVFTAAATAVESGEIILEEGTEINDYHLMCSAKVKGLNPPGKSQNHPQGIAACNVASAPSCPGWSDEELATIGSYAPSRILEDHENAGTGLYGDQEQTYFLDSEGYHINHGAWVRIAGSEYQAHYFVQTHESICFDCPVENLIQRVTVLTHAEYEACKQELLAHETTTCSNGYELQGNCID
jgi:hypothetical protein